MMRARQWWHELSCRRKAENSALAREINLSHVGRKLTRCTAKFMTDVLPDEALEAIIVAVTC
jgi:hypothetical protein